MEPGWNYLALWYPESVCGTCYGAGKYEKAKAGDYMTTEECLQQIASEQEDTDDVV